MADRNRVRNLRPYCDVRCDRLLIIENSEPAPYAIMEELGARNRAAVVEGRIADIRDRERLMRQMNEFKA